MILARGRPVGETGDQPLEIARGGGIHQTMDRGERGFVRGGHGRMWMLVSPEVYELLVVRRGWLPERFGEFVATTMIAALLPPGD